MDFSVLMSVYGEDLPKHFKEALESVTIKQTVRPSQVVIIKDGPVPSEIDAIISLVDSETENIEFTVISKEKNSGLSSALNTGLKVCKYNWVARMDSDDIATPDRFEKQTVYLSTNTAIDVLGGAIAEFENTPGDLQSVRHVCLTHDEIVHMARTRTPLNHTSVFYSKTAVQKAGNYSEDFGRLEDYKLWIDLISSGAKMANIEDVIVFVRVGNGFIERRGNKREIKDWDMLQEFLLKADIIGKRKSIINKAYIRVFIYMPSWMKKIVYKKLLRK
ncbi:MAG: glycosyltransferase [Clostridia bacterium]|nr:glycosyltransferase [Clostridia bacterium]